MCAHLAAYHQLAELTNLTTLNKFTGKYLMLLIKSFVEWGRVEGAETSSILSKVRSHNDPCETRNNGLDSGNRILCVSR